MKLEFSGFKHTDSSPLAEALASIRHVESLGYEKPLLMAYTPVARMNPFQALLYSSFLESGIAVTPLIKPLLFDRLTQLRTLVSDVVVHLHWNSVILAGAKDLRDARKRVDSFKERVDRFTSAGGKLMWTVHNLLPHDAEYLDEEMELQQFIADRCSVIHTMSRATDEAMTGILNLDKSKVLVSPHPSYEGAYEDYVGRHEARMTLGIDSDEIVYVLLGAIKPYKGVSRFIEGFDEFGASATGRRRLIVAGEPDTSTDTARLLDVCRQHPNILLDDRKIPANLVQYYLRAADIAVVPYLRVLNSGAALLGPTFGLPVIASRSGSLPEVLDHSFAEFIEASGVDSVARALRRGDRLLDEEARRAAEAFAQRLTPRPVSHAFAEQLRKKLNAS